MNKFALEDCYLGLIELTYELKKYTDMDNKPGTFGYFMYNIKGLKENGAITVEDYFENYNHFVKILSLFIKTDNGYLSLHDGKLYNDKNQYSKCNYVFPFKNVLPKVDFYQPTELNYKDALLYFNLLFAKKKGVKDLLLSEKHDLNELYYGPFYLQEYEQNGEKKQRVNYIEKRQIDNIINPFNNNEECLSKDIYQKYLCAFIKTNDGLINLCNNQLYCMDDIKDDEFKPFEEYLDEKKIHHGKRISLSKVIKNLK